MAPVLCPMDYFHSKRFLDTLPDWETGRPLFGPVEDYLPRMRALLQRLGDPQQHFTSIIVGGTNGKGTVSSLLAALLQAAGHRVGLYTSPHLHTLRERIQVSGQIPDKDLWAESVTFLHDRTRDFEAEGFGPFSQFEALTGLAAHMWARAGMEYGVFEVGLGGRYDATNAWDSAVAVLTSISLDHAQVLGESLSEIAAEKLPIARPGHPLFTTAAQSPEVLDYIRRQSRERRIDLYIAGASGIETPKAAPPLAYPWTPTALPGRPRTYLDNARLAAAVTAYLLGDARAGEVTGEVVRTHQWPGRFEIARQQPLVLLDGAHNPAGAAALAEDLGSLSPEWTFVIGVSRGHDAAGILRAVQPLARKVVLTCSDHPRALAVEALATSAPEGLQIEKQAASIRAFEETLAALQPQDHLCIMGSLHLVARAREFFNLSGEREGISEEVALESLACIERACQNRGMACVRASDNGHILRLTRHARPLYFLRNKHPFNDYVGAHLAEDKGYQYELFTRAGLPMPFTIQVFNPFADARFDRYKTHGSVEEIGADVERRFTYPVLAKKYRSSVAQGVYLEGDTRALKKRLNTLFEHSGFGDNIVLIQAYVAGPEYRIVASQGELLLAYEKQADEKAVKKGDLNPLHQEGGRAVKVVDPELLQAMQELSAAVAAVVDLGFYAIDLIRGEDGFYILEINPNPFCFFYNQSNGRDDFVRIYEYLIEKYVEAGE